MSNLWSRRRLAGVAVVTSLLLAACGGTDGGETTDGDEVTEAEQAADGDQSVDGGAASEGPAALTIIEPGVDVADEPADVDVAEFRTGEDGESLAVADLVRTDRAGFAEVRWTEGALARIDVDTLFEVTELDLSTGRPKVSTRLEVGRVWNRLAEDSADYEVATDVGTAAVRGTGFLVSCDENCTFGLVEGVLAVTTSLGIEVELRPGEQVDVDTDGRPAGIEPFDYDDAWVQENLRRDGEAGFPAVERVTPNGDGGRTQTARGRLDGTYQFSFTVQDSTQSELEGQQVDRTWVYFPDCAEGPCGGDWDPGDGNREPFEWTGSGYTTSWVDRPAGACPDGSPRWEEDFVLTITPTAVDDAGLVSELDARWVSTLTPLPEAVESGCDPGQGDVDQVLVGSAVLADGGGATAN